MSVKKHGNLAHAKKFLFSLVGVVILALIFNKLEFEKTFHYLLHIPFYFLAGVLFFEAGEVLWKAWRWQYILKGLGIMKRYRELVAFYWMGLFLGAVTPAKIGDFSRGVLFKDMGHSLKPILSVVIDRVLDLAMLFSLGLLFGFFYTKNMVFIYCLAAVLAGTVGFFLVIGLLNKRASKASRFVEPFLGFIRRLTGSKDFFPEDEKKRIDLRNFSLSRIAVITATLCAGWGSYFFGWLLLARALDISIAWVYLVGIVSFASIIAVLPISIGGIGTRDLTIVYLMSFFGIAKEKALAFSLGIFFVNMIVCMVGIFFYMNWAVRKK